MDAIPLGIWTLDGFWMPNPKLNLSAKAQYDSNVKNGFPMKLADTLNILDEKARRSLRSCRVDIYSENQGNNYQVPSFVGAYQDPPNTVQF